MFINPFTDHLCSVKYLLLNKYPTLAGHMRPQPTDNSTEQMSGH